MQHSAFTAPLLLDTCVDKTNLKNPAENPCLSFLVFAIREVEYLLALNFNVC